MNNKKDNTNRDSKSNLTLRLSSSTSLQSLEAKAARAAIIAAMGRSLSKSKTESSVGPQKRSKRTLTQLERELRTIRSAFERTSFDRTEVIFDKPASGSSAVCIIRTAVRMNESHETPQGQRTSKEETKRTYVFYPSTTDPGRLGSVAIYGTNVASEGESIRRKGSLFGIEIGEVSVKIGRRPFLDVTFRA